MNYRFSGHETFPCRYAWLPKAVRAIEEDSRILGDDERAMVALGVGKNMARAIRFWVQAAGMATFNRIAGYTITPFGHDLLGPGGLDPFLEDARTLWLIHWKFSTQMDEPLFAWDYLLNRWHHPEIGRMEVLRTFQQEAKRLDRTLSPVTIEQHFDTFLHTYVPTGSPKGAIQEDNLDCPLVELNLIQRIGERKIDGSNRSEAVYAFRREPKPDVTPELFAYCLDEFWVMQRSHEETLTFRDVSVAHGSPGQVFKLPEWDVRERLESFNDDPQASFGYRESAALQQVYRRVRAGHDFLMETYGHEGAMAHA